MDDIVELKDQQTAVNSPENGEELEVDELDPSDSEAPTDMTRMLLKGTSRKLLAKWGPGSVPAALRQKHEKKRQRRTSQRDKKAKEGAVAASKVKSRQKGKGKGKERQEVGKENIMVRGEGSSASLLLEEDLSPSDTEDDCPSPPPKRARPSRSTNSRTPATLEPRQHIAYILLSKSDPLPSSTARFSKHKGPPETSQHKPITFDNTTAFSSFRGMLSATLDCSPDILSMHQATWQCEKPANSAKRPLTDDESYQAMLVQLDGRPKGQVVVNIRMPEPVREDRPATKHGVNISQSEFGYDDVVADPVGSSIQAQIAHTRGRSDVQIQLDQLLTQYPVNNVVTLFPGKRVFSRNDRYWELNQCRLNVWAVALANRAPGVDLNTPPNSMHFQTQNALRTPSKPQVALQAISGADESPMSSTLSGLVAQQYQLFQMMQWQQMQAQSAFMPPMGWSPAPAAVPTVGVGAPAAAGPSTARRVQGIPLAEFAAKYDIPGEDVARLEQLGFVPGDPQLEAIIGETLWRAEGFKPYAWGRVLLANKDFISDSNSSSL